MHEGAAAPSYSIRSGGMYAARSGPSGRFLYHFPAVTEGDRKMMQLGKMKISFFRRVLTLSTPRAAQSAAFEIRSGGMYAARLEALWASKSPKATADGKIEDFDAAPSERPKWPLPISFSFSPRAAFHLPGVPALRSACSARPATRREYARQIYDLPSLVALRAPSKRCPRASSRVNAASDRPSPKVTKEGGR